jgi:hypothetical protein
MTQITIIVDDKTVYVDGKGLSIPDLDWGLFNGDPASPWDDIHAVQYDTARKQGYVEYKTVPTAQLGRPDIKPPDWAIDDADFEANFAWVLPVYDAKKLVADAEVEARRIQANEAPAAVEAVPVDAATRDELDELKAQNAALETKLNTLLSEMAGGKPA